MLKFFRSDRSLLTEILENQRKIMGDFTALNAAVASLNSAVQANTAAVADVAAVVANLKVVPDQSQIDAVTTAVSAAANQVTTNTANMEALKPAPIVVPASS